MIFPIHRLKRMSTMKRYTLNYFLSGLKKDCHPADYNLYCQDMHLSTLQFDMIIKRYAN